MEPEIKVTKINKKWHARLIEGSVVKFEMACKLKQDIGWICREMLKWYDKLGGESKFASSARNRQTSNSIGKVWRIAR